MSYPLIMVNDRFTTVINNKSYTVDPEHPKYDLLLDCVKLADGETFVDNFTVEKAVTKKFEDTGVEIRHGEVYYNGEVMHNEITNRIVGFTDKDLPTEPLIKFLDNLMQNPSKRSVDELYGFLEHRNLPITEDGCFLAYKAVRNNYLDKHSGTFDNSVGAVVEMPRNKVDDNANNTCSVGFHVGALEYAGPNGFFCGSNDRVVIVKVNPKDAVSVPLDHCAQKLRVCRYEVVGEYEKPLDDDYAPPEQSTPEIPCNAMAAFFQRKLKGKTYFENHQSYTPRTSHSHFGWNGWKGAFSVSTLIDTYTYNDGSKIVVRFNTDDSERWIKVLGPDSETLTFERLTEAY